MLNSIAKVVGRGMLLLPIVWIVVGKQPVEKIVNDETTDPNLKRRLVLAQSAREFALQELGLPNNKSYTSFYDTGKPYVTWNVVASEEFSFRPKTWCFPIAGCVSYRGYYAEEDAESYAETLSTEGLDVSVNGATAYSTLGWFKDPLLNTMLARSDAGIASLLFHELAHQQLYVGDDSTFNESFASFVEQEGLQHWLRYLSEKNPDRDYSAVEDALKARRTRRDDFIDLLSQTREDLETLYSSNVDRETMRERKRARFEQMRDEYRAIKESKWDGYVGYDAWFAREMNNSRLVSIGTYNDYIPAFHALFVQSGSSFAEFYAAAHELAELEASERTKKMQQLLAESSGLIQ